MAPASGRGFGFHGSNDSRAWTGWMCLLHFPGPKPFPACICSEHRARGVLFAMERQETLALLYMSDCCGLSRSSRSVRSTGVHWKPFVDPVGEHRTCSRRGRDRAIVRTANAGPVEIPKLLIKASLNRSALQRWWANCSQPLQVCPLDSAWTSFGRTRACSRVKVSSAATCGVATFEVG